MLGFVTQPGINYNMSVGDVGFRSSTQPTGLNGVCPHIEVSLGAEFLSLLSLRSQRIMRAG
jgi:hypothetical protein